MKQQFLFIFFFLILSSFVWGQTNPCVKVTSRRAHKLYEKALTKLENDDIKAGYSLLKEAVKTEPKYAKAYYELGYINYQKAYNALFDAKEARNVDRYRNKAVKYFTKAIKYCPRAGSYKSYYYLGLIFQQQKKYKQTIENLNAFVTHYKHDDKPMQEAQKILKKINKAAKLILNPVPFSPEKVMKISTPDDEFLPLISSDGELAFFTRQYFKHIKAENTQRQVNEFMVAQRETPLSDTREVFSSGTTMAKPFNQKNLDQGAVALTIDNKQMFITICKFLTYKGRRYKNCDIYVTHYTDGHWGELVNLGPAINNPNTWESQPSVSADGKTLYFASVRPQNIGFSRNNQTSDIYYSTFKNGHWTKAKNMGSVINTKGDEKSPFIHTDSKTLYFSSNGHNGVGGMDIFYSQQQKNGRWNKPKNIGYPINSEGDDLGFIVSTNGEKAYFSSSRFDNSGGWDIYSFNLYKEARPHKVVFIKGKLINESGQAITDAKVELKTSNGTTSSGMVDKKTGSYAVAVAVDDTKEKVVMVVKKKNGTFSAKAINTKKATKTPVKVEMQVHTLKTGTPFEIPDIQFATNSAVFDQESMFVLDNFVDYLKENSKLKIGIYGHTDNVGDPQKNMKLSQERAQSVRDYLVLMGIKSKRIVTVKGFGDTKPIASNNTAQGRAKNRRTEFIIMGK